MEHPEPAVFEVQTDSSQRSDLVTKRPEPTRANIPPQREYISPSKQQSLGSCIDIIGLDLKDQKTESFSSEVYEKGAMNDADIGLPSILLSRPSDALGCDLDLMNEEAPNGKVGPQPMEGILRPAYFALCSDMASDLRANQKRVLAQIKFDRKWKVKQEWQSALPRDLRTVPCHALEVRWRLAHNLPSYTVEVVYNYLIRYGEIEGMCQLSNNSVLVVFQHIQTAQRVIQCGRLDPKTCPLIISWWYPQMYREENQVEEELAHPVPSCVPTHSATTLAQMKWSDMQQKVTRLIKRMEGDLSYNLDEFVP